MEIAVISDTHVPSQTRGIPGWVRSRVQAADHTVHAGDFDTRRTLDRVETLADGNLTAVTGNADPVTLDAPAVATVAFEGVRFVVTHGHRQEDYFEGVAATTREEGADVAVSGHTHAVHDETCGGIRLLNPGSATGVGPAEAATMMVVTVEEGSVSVDVERR